MSSKCFKKGIEIKQIKLSFSNSTSSFSPVYVYHGQVSKRLTKKIIVFLEQWKDAIDEENEDRLDSLYQNNIDTIIAYLNECKLDKFIDLDEWDGEDDLPDSTITNTCCKACRVHEFDDPRLEFVLSCGCVMYMHL